LASAERELDALINAPVSGGRDPFEWLPDELIVMILERMSFEALVGCDHVCERWARLMKSAPITRVWHGRWAAYEAGTIKPRVLESCAGGVTSLAVGLDGKVYSGSADSTIRVWSGTDGTHLKTLEGHTSAIFALAVGLDGKVYSASALVYSTIRVWWGVDGRLLHTLKRDHSVFALAVTDVGILLSASVRFTLDDKDNGRNHELISW